MDYLIALLLISAQFLYLPAGSDMETEAAYRSTDFWKEFPISPYCKHNFILLQHMLSTKHSSTSPLRKPSQGDWRHQYGLKYLWRFCWYMCCLFSCLYHKYWRLQYRMLLICLKAELQGRKLFSFSWVMREMMSKMLNLIVFLVLQVDGPFLRYLMPWNVGGPAAYSRTMQDIWTCIVRDYITELWSVRQRSEEAW